MFLVNSVWSQTQQQQQQPHSSPQEGKKDKMKDYLLDDMEIAMKVVIVGNGSVGKSSMIQRFCRGIFTRDYKKTIGVDFLERILMIEGQAVRLMLWDTAGQEEFDAITRTYYRGANACVLACSVTDRDSFTALPKWKTKVCRECGDIPMVLVANKMDLQKQALVDSSSLESMARSLGITHLFKTSVKEDLNVSTVFHYLAQQYVNSVMALEESDAAEDLLEPETDFLSPIDHHHLVDPARHPKSFHFGHFNNNKNKGLSSSSTNNNLIVSSKKPKKQGPHLPIYPNSNNGHKNYSKYSPVILKSQPQPILGSLPVKGFFSAASPKKSHHQHLNFSQHTSERYSFSASGNHHTHWDNNMPFRLDLLNHGHKKRRKELCAIL